MPAHETTPTGIAELVPAVRDVDLSAPRRVHVIGAGGAGMRAIARVLASMGHRVSGSDLRASDQLEALSSIGVETWVGHQPARMAECELVTRSTAVPAADPEVLAATDAAVTVLSRAEMLRAIAASRPSVLVAGTHGKTTTASLLVAALGAAGRDPSFIIGSDLVDHGSGAVWTDAGELAVIEADESDGTFLVLPAAHAIVTSIDPDHLDFYSTSDRLTAAFAAFVDGVAGLSVVCRDDAGELAERKGVVTYGVDPASDLIVSDVVVERTKTRFRADYRGDPLGTIEVALPGHHNALNAAAALTLALELGVDAGAAREGLASFGGVARRFEHRGAVDGIDFVDDYAHLPAEVEAALATARSGGWRRVVASYQPHRFTRTRAIGPDFGGAFAGADELLLTDIYPSGEAPIEGVDGRIVLDAVKAASPALAVTYAPSLADVEHHLADILRPGDLCLTLGAGDLTTVPDRVMDRLRHAGYAEVAWLRRIAGDLPSCRISWGEPLGRHTTYRVGGRAHALVDVGALDDLRSVIEAAQRAAASLLVIGRGSNLLVADRGFDGVALRLDGDFEQIAIDENTVVAGAAASLPVLARATVAAGLTGFEWAVGVPGSIGGAVAMNAGGHGSDMAASVRSADVIDLETGTVRTIPAADLAFRYRGSSIGPHDLVIAATIELAAGDRATGESALTEIVRWRRENQPGGQNAGSVFTNPLEDSAGRLIDEAGGKGLRVGSAEVSSKHANFIQVDPDGSADDVFALMQRVAGVVEAATGTTLTPETRLIGFPPFEPELSQP